MAAAGPPRAPSSIRRGGGPICASRPRRWPRACCWRASAPSASPGRSAAKPREARCGGEVILAAGAVKSPHLLELSGIGQPELLQSAGIEVRHELPRRRRELPRPLRAAHELARQAAGHAERADPRRGADAGGREVLHAASRRADLHRRHRLWLCEDAAGTGGAGRAVSFRPCELRQRADPRAGA